MIIFTDLDSTLVYSREYSHVCVEHKEDGTPVTYMTQEARMKICSLMERDDVLLIPCTSRSFEQTKRIFFTMDGKLPVMICDGGFSIYRNGILDKEWDAIIRRIVNTNKVNSLCSYMENYAKSHDIPYKVIGTKKDSFINIIFKSAEDKEKFASSFKKIAGDDYWFSEESKKLYILPKHFGKELAVFYIMQQYVDESSIGIGDSNIDKGFVEICKTSIVPNHAKFSTDKEIRTKDSGIKAGEEILDILLTLS